MTSSRIPPEAIEDWPTCACGCGDPAPIIKRTNRKKGLVAGQPRKFIAGHNHRSFATLEERFWSKVQKGGADDCWPWLASKTDKGYGNFWKEGREEKAYRVAYELSVGPIPEGLHMDHLCRNPECVNPAHLEPVTQRENILRGVGASAQSARKTHCPKGHPYDEENTKYYDGPYGRYRTCRACSHIKKVKEARREREARRAAKEAAK